MSTTQSMHSRHNYILLLIADFISSFGSSMTGVALTLFIYDNTDNLMASASFATVALLPQLIVSPFLHRIRFKLSFRKIFAVGELLCAIPIAVMLLTDSILLIYVAFFCYAAVFFILECLRAEYLKLITDDNEMQKRQSASRVVNTLVTVVGPLAGGALLSRLGVHSVYLFDIASYMAATLIILFIRGDQKPSSFESGYSTDSRPFESIRKNGDIFAGSLIITFLGGSISILTLEYIYKVINADAMQYSMLMSAMAMGSLIGSALGGISFAQRHLRKISHLCTVVMGCLLLSVILKPGFVVLVGILAISGVLSALVMLYYSVELFLRSTQDRMREQYAVFQNITDISSAASKPFGAVMNQLLGCVKAISFLGVFFLITGLCLRTKR